jgi:hypothetical protein
MFRKRGAVYVAVLMASLIVASLAMAALNSAHFYASNINHEAEYVRCQMAADAALEWAIAEINSDSSWRTNYSHNVDTAARLINGVEVRYRLIDADGDLSDDAADPCDVLVYASTSTATCCWRAALAPAGPAYNCLNFAMASRNELKLEELTVVSTDGNVASQDDIVVQTSGTLTGNCFAAGNCQGEIHGTVNGLAETLDFPNWDAFSQYVDNATWIDANTLPTSSGQLQLNAQLLSRQVNTISGQLNPLGIYAIDCQGSDIRISNSRLECTLILINTGSDSLADAAIFWEAARANYPALLVDGNFELRLGSSHLREASLGVNFNPPGTPFRGLSDSDTSTIYPSQIRGLIFTTGELVQDSTWARSQVFGTLLSASNITLRGLLTIHYRDVFALDPPPGFRSFASVRLAPGSIRRVAAP